MIVGKKYFKEKIQPALKKDNVKHSVKYQNNLCIFNFNKKIKINQNTRILDCDLSIRTLNRIFHFFTREEFNNLRIKDLPSISMSRLKELRGFGEKSMNELLSLMKLAKVKFKDQ